MDRYTFQRHGTDGPDRGSDDIWGTRVCRSVQDPTEVGQSGVVGVHLRLRDGRTVSLRGLESVSWTGVASVRGGVSGRGVVDGILGPSIGWHGGLTKETDTHPLPSSTSLT